MGGLLFEVGGGREECVYEEYAEKEKIEFDFDIVEGGKLDIELKIFAPGGSMVLQRMVTFSADNDPRSGTVDQKISVSGVYKICFNNRASRWVAKVVRFTMGGSKSTSHKHYEELAELQHLGPMVSSIISISHKLDEIENIQERTDSREDVHHQILVKSEEYLTWATMMETLILLGVSVWNI